MTPHQFGHGLASGLAEGWWMFFDTFWALVLGFALSGVVQAFVSRRRMQTALGNHGPAALARASFFGVVSSSCSYAASALAKTLFARGADFTASMVFMIASTNLVVELGIVIWLLLGWQFALAEFVGGFMMIGLLGFAVPRLIPARWIADAQRTLAAADEPAEAAQQPHGVRTRAGWSDASGYAISDLTMLRKELVAGFAIAGFASALVPGWFWRSLFTTGHGFWSSLENVVLGPFLALISFVCSVGNVPLAAALWRGGASFGGVIAFVFADLITLPLLVIYRKYYGTRLMLRLLAVFWAAMSIAGLATEYLFKAVHLVPTTVHAPVRVTHAGANYTTVLDIAAAVGLAVLYALYRDGKQRASLGDAANPYATDVVCGMQVRKAEAPARLTYRRQTFFFCSDRCRERFRANPAKFTNQTNHPVVDHMS